MADAEQGVHHGPSQSKIVLAKPKLGGFGAGNCSTGGEGTRGNPFGKIGSGYVLRPPQLKPVLANPFLRVSTGDNTVNTASDDDKDTCEDRLKGTEKEQSEAPKFVPLGANTTVASNPVPAPAPASSASSTSGFVFGQNLSERVVVTGAQNNGGPGMAHSSTNGNTELLFSNAVASNSQEECSTSTSTGAGEGLAAAAAEYERSHARPQLLAAPPTTTGEEDETNVLQITCRLFAWEAGSWRERGRGALRLNDTECGSRLVCRVLGSLRVVLNTKLWADMVADRASAKSLRITATDPQQQVKVFLVMAAPTEIAQLHRALTSRISACRKAPDCGPIAPKLTDHIDQHPGDDDDDEQYDDNITSMTFVNSKMTRDNSAVMGDNFNTTGENYNKSSENSNKSTENSDMMEDNSNLTESDVKGENFNIAVSNSTTTSANSRKSVDNTNNSVEDHVESQNNTNEVEENSLKRKVNLDHVEESSKRPCPDIVAE